MYDPDPRQRGLCGLATHSGLWYDSVRMGNEHPVVLGETMRAIVQVVLVVVVGLAGWVIGSVYPAPSMLIVRINPQALVERTRGDLQDLNWDSLRTALGESGAKSLALEAVRLAVRAGSVITVEHETDAATGESENPARGPIVVPTHGTFEASVALCPRMTISNSPPSDAAGQVAPYAPVVNVKGVALAVDPTRDSCLSSGFGVRGGRLHKGVDYYNVSGGQVMAAGDGVIVEMKYRDDYGNMYLIDHGHGVYTRYAHLSMFQRGLSVGAAVHAGDPIGLMGNTASYPIPVHLHYEVLLGNYKNPRASFGLTPHSPFEYRATG